MLDKSLLGYLHLKLVFLIVSAGGSLAFSQVRDVPKDVRETLDLDTFYQKYADVGGLPVVGSSQVTDAALMEAVWIVRKMIGQRTDILNAMANNKTRLAVMAYNEYTTDIPEHRHLTPRVYWDRRARGLGAPPRAPAVTCAEENLLGYSGDPYPTENICIHEFAHAIHEMGMKTIDPSFDARLKAAYARARAKGMWKDTYALSNHQEYWAEAVQSWFDDNRENDALHNHVNTRRELIEYDPDLAQLCKEVFGNGPWRYKRPSQRPGDEKKHLKELNVSAQPLFQWREESISKKPKVLFQTSLGDFELELELEKSPERIELLLTYVHRGFFSNGEISLTPSLEKKLAGSGGLRMVRISVNSREKSEWFRSVPRSSRPTAKGLALDGIVAVAPGWGAAGRDELVVCWEESSEARAAGGLPSDWIVLGSIRNGQTSLKRMRKWLTRQEVTDARIEIQRAIRLN